LLLALSSLKRSRSAAFAAARLHLRHRGVGLVGERKNAALITTVTRDGDAEMADQPVDVVDQEEQRLGDEVEPAPVDQQIDG